MRCGRYAPACAGMIGLRHSTTPRRPSRVLAMGNTIIDTVLSMPEMPADGKIFVDVKNRFVGGQGANAAQGMALLGLDVSFLTRVGDDTDGRHAKQHFDAMGIDTRHCMLVPGVPTMSACVVVSTAMQTRSCLMHRDERMFEHDLGGEIDRVDLRTFDTLYTDGHQMDLLLPLVHKAMQCGLRVVADVEVINPQTEELAMLASELIAPAQTICTLASESDPAKAVVALARRRGRMVVGTAGADGSYGALHNSTRHIHVPAEKCNVTDTTGAGDAYHTGFLAALAREEEPTLEEAMVFATRTAAALCETPGPVVSAEALERWGVLSG